MSCRFAYLAAMMSSVLVHPAFAQTARPDPVGTWRGTSLCQVRPSACHDENVVFRITRTNTRDSLAMDGRKIVNDAEVEMGVLACRFDTAIARLTCPLPDGSWQFTIHGDSLVGELRQPDGTKVRDVRTMRSGSPGAVPLIRSAVETRPLHVGPGAALPPDPGAAPCGRGGRPNGKRDS